MPQSFEKVSPQEYRDEKAEELREMRSAGQKVEAINYLGSLAMDPQYQEARSHHKNVIAEASNERVAEGILSDTEIVAFQTVKKLSLLMMRCLVDEHKISYGLKRNIESAEENITAARFLAALQAEVGKLENSGADCEAVAKWLQDKASTIQAEVNELYGAKNEVWDKQLWGGAEVMDVQGAVLSWFDGVREAILSRKMDKLDAATEKLSVEGGLIRWVKKAAEAEPELKVSVILERLVLQLKKLIQSDLLAKD